MLNWDMVIYFLKSEDPKDCSVDFNIIEEVVAQKHTPSPIQWQQFL